jgi:hypothetical protein
MIKKVNKSSIKDQGLSLKTKNTNIIPVSKTKAVEPKANIKNTKVIVPKVKAKVKDKPSTTSSIKDKKKSTSTVKSSKDNKDTKPIKLGPLALYKAKLAEKKLKEIAKKEAKSIANKAKSSTNKAAISNSKDKSKSKSTTKPTVVDNKATNAKSIEDMPSIVDEDVDALLKKFEAKLPKPKDYLKEFVDKHKDDKDD